MTSRQRNQDFKQICSFLKRNVPFIDEYKMLYGFGFDEITDYYSSLIKNVNSDFEYYTCLEGFFNNIPSGHLNIGYPNSDYIMDFYKFRTNDYTDFNLSCQYWENQIKMETQKYANCEVRFETFMYADGEYLQSEYYAEKNGRTYNGSKLVAIDGIPIDEFIKLCPLEYKLQYDHVNKKPFRSIFILNDTCGNKCMAEYKFPNGETVSEIMYYGTKGTDALKYADYFKPQEDGTYNSTGTERSNHQYEKDYSAQEIINNNIYTYNNSDEKVTYIMFNDFIYGGAEFSNFLDNAEIQQSIIIDLRNNLGGYEDVSVGIIKKLINRTIEYNTDVYTPNNYGDFEKKIINGKRLYVDTRYEIINGSSQKDYNIYVLVSSETLSAADNFAAFIKDNALGVIIGENNTHGEAYGSPDLKVLETSGLYFYYTDRKWNNSDGTDNSVYGTAPDIYVPFDEECMKVRDKLMVNNEVIYTYENRLKWDNVLIETLELIKEDENDKGNNTANE